MNWYPNSFASYGGIGRPVNAFDEASYYDAMQNYRFLHNHAPTEHHHYHCPPNDYYPDRRPTYEEFRRDYYERHSSASRNDYYRLSSPPENSFRFSSSHDDQYDYGELNARSSSSRSKRGSTRDEYDSDDGDQHVHTAKRYKSNSGEIKLTKIEQEFQTMRLVNAITSVEGVPYDLVYDSCPEVVEKINEFLAHHVIKKKHFLMALGGINHSSFNKFLAGTRQEQAGNKTYRNAYIFFEQMRILMGEPKSAARIRNEMEHPYGFELKKPRNPRILGQPYRPYGSSASNSVDWLGAMHFF